MTFFGFLEKSEYLPRCLSSVLLSNPHTFDIHGSLQSENGYWVSETIRSPGQFGYHTIELKPRGTSITAHVEASDDCDWRLILVARDAQWNCRYSNIAKSGENVELAVKPEDRAWALIVLAVPHKYKAHTHEDEKSKTFPRYPFKLTLIGAEPYQTLNQAIVLYMNGDKKDAAKLARKLLSEFAGTAAAPKIKHLIYLCQPAKVRNLSEVKEEKVYLSEVEWSKASVGWGHPARDQYYSDRKIQNVVLLNVGGQFYSRGLYAHVPAVYEYDLNKGWTTFSSVIGLQDNATTWPSFVKFVVKGDGKVLYESKPLKRPNTEKLSVDVSGVSKLELIVESAGKDNHFCWSIWCNPQLKR